MRRFERYKAKLDRELVRLKDRGARLKEEIARVGKIEREQSGAAHRAGRRERRPPGDEE